jgi:DNA-binding MarR family transcriptional regulator
MSSINGAMNMNETFLKVNKKYFNNKLKPLEILILSQIEEFNNNNCECYLTNKQLAGLFGVNIATVARTLTDLEEANYIKRFTRTVNNKGYVSKERVLALVNKTEKKTNGFNYSF